MKRKLKTIKAYTKAELKELKRISELPQEQRRFQIKQFTLSFKRSYDAAWLKMYNTYIKGNESISTKNHTPTVHGREIALDIKSLRIEGNKLFISL